MASEFSVSDKCRIKDVKVFTDKVLGTGSYGVVYKAVYHGTLVAAKKLHGIFFEGVSLAEFKGILHSWQQELELMSSLRHPNIVQFYGVYNSHDSSSLQLSGDSYIISELMAKSLQARNSEQPKLNFPQIVDIVMDIASGLCYLHNREHPIMHRDLASKNILLSVSGQAKIADLGVAKITLSAQTSHTRHPGTDLYMPVEAVIGSNDYDHSIDVYGLGVITLELSIGKDPTATQCMKRVNGRIEAVPEKERRQKDFDEFKQHGYKELEVVIMPCLEEKEARITATMIVVQLDKIQNGKLYHSIPKPPIFDYNKTSIESDTHEQNIKLRAKLTEAKEEINNLMEKNKELQKELEKNKYEMLKKEKVLNSHTQTNRSNKLELVHRIPEKFSSLTLSSQPHNNRPLSSQPHNNRLPTSLPPYINSQQSQLVISDQQKNLRSNNFEESNQLGLAVNCDMHRSFSDKDLQEYDIDEDEADVPPLPTAYVDSTRVPCDRQCVSLPPPNMREAHLVRRPALYEHLHETDRSHLSKQYTYNTPPNVQVQSPSPMSSSTYATAGSADFPHAQITVKEANEYLSYQASCINRVINQLMIPNNSDNLQSSFVQTLKEQIIKTDTYIQKIPFPLVNVSPAIQHIRFQLNKVSTFNLHVSYYDKQALYEVMHFLQTTIGRRC